MTYLRKTVPIRITKGVTTIGLTMTKGRVTIQ
jgi:hypothetical protein